MRGVWMAAREDSRAKGGRETTGAPWRRGACMGGGGAEGWVEAGQDDDGGALAQGRVHEGGEAVDVEERQYGEDAVAGGRRHDRFELGEVGGDLAVGEHDAFGGAGGARGVREGGDVLGGVDV